MGYNPNCIYTNCKFNCCNYYGYCPQTYSSYFYYTPEYTSCYHYYQVASTATIVLAVLFSVLATVVIVVVSVYCYRKYQQKQEEEKKKKEKNYQQNQENKNNVCLAYPKKHNVGQKEIGQDIEIQPEVAPDSMGESLHELNQPKYVYAHQVQPAYGQPQNPIYIITDPPTQRK